jgi:hypothetical protein
MSLPVPFGQTDLGKFAKPVDTFIKVVAAFIGVRYEPKRIIKDAEAKAIARRIEATTDVEVELIYRSLERRIRDDIRSQENVEAVVRKAIPLVSEEAKPRDMNTDWMAHFFENARMYSDEEMQILWAKVLAGEVNAPGKFSRGTVALLSTIDKRDAELFATVRRFCINLEGVFIPLIYKLNDKIYQTNGINSQVLIRLEETGLVRFAPMYSAEYETRTIDRLKKRRFIEYFGERIWFKQGDQGGDAVATGAVTLTQAGRELAPICDAKPIAGFVDYLKVLWKSFGMEIEDAVAP